MAGPGDGSAGALSAADASNLVLDASDQVNAVLLAGVFGPGGFVGKGTVDLARLRVVIAERLADPRASGLRRFSQRVAGLPRRPRWEVCVPDLDWHVREVAAVAGRAGLAALCAQLMTAPLPRDRPLWELLIVPGVAEVGTGVVLRVHHAVADGVAAVGLAQQLFDPVVGRPAARHSTASQAAAAGPAPGPRRLTGNRMGRLLTSATRILAVFKGRLPPTVLLGPISPERGLAFVEVGLPQLARGARSAGGTINDALLAAVSTVATTALQDVGEPVPVELPASVPVALPERGGSGNAVGVMMVRLPLAEPDLTARIARIAASTRLAKAEARAGGTYEFTRSRWGSRLFAVLARRQRFIALFVTNVRGPEVPLSLAGAPLQQAWPVTPIQGNVRLGVSALSYAGKLQCGIHVDAAVLDADLLGAALEAELRGVQRIGAAATV